MAFEAARPQDKENEVRQAELAIDNVGHTLTQWIDLSAGGRGAVMRIMEVVIPQQAGQESGITWEQRLTCGVTRITNDRVTLSLVDHAIFGRPAVLLRHDAETSPGLF